MRHGADPRTADLEYEGQMVCGTFVDLTKPTFRDNLDAAMQKALGDEYRPIEIDSAHAARAERRAAMRKHD